MNIHFIKTFAQSILRIIDKTLNLGLSGKVSADIGNDANANHLRRHISGTGWVENNDCKVTLQNTVAFPNDAEYILGQLKEIAELFGLSGEGIDYIESNLFSGPVQFRMESISLVGETDMPRNELLLPVTKYQSGQNVSDGSYQIGHIAIAFDSPAQYINFDGNLEDIARRVKRITSLADRISKLEEKPAYRISHADFNDLECAWANAGKTDPKETSGKKVDSKPPAK